MKQVLAEGSFFISDIQADPNTIWAVFYDDETDLLKLITSDSRGDNWSRPVPVADAGYYFSDILFDTAADAKHLYLAYYSDGDQSLNFLKTDASGTPVAQRKLFSSSQFNEPVSIAIDGDRTYIVSADIRSSGFDVSGSIFLMQSDDGGSTWNQRRNLLTIGDQVSSLDPYNIDTAVDSRGNLMIAVSRIMKDSSYTTRIYSLSRTGELNDITPEGEFYAGSNAGKGIALSYFFDTAWFAYVNAENHAYDLLAYDGNQWELVNSVPVNEETHDLKIPELLVTHSAVLLAYSEEILDPPSIIPVYTIAASYDNGKTFTSTFKINPDSKALSRFGLAWDGSYIYSLHIEQDNRKSSKSLMFLRFANGNYYEKVKVLDAKQQLLERKVEDLGETVTEIYETIDPADRLYAIGDKGPSGGLIFYDDKADGVDDFPGYRYLEAAPYGWYNGKDDPAVQWGRSFHSRPVSPSAKGTELGDGIVNTEHIVQYHDGLGGYYDNPQKYDALNDGTVAAKICRGFELENDGKVYDDWYLPAINELELMYENLHTQDLGDFFMGFYWSSSEDSSYDARRFEFSSGLRNSSRKDLRHYVRPIRTF